MNEEQKLKYNQMVLDQISKLQTALDLSKEALVTVSLTLDKDDEQRILDDESVLEVEKHITVLVEERSSIETIKNNLILNLLQ